MKKAINLDGYNEAEIHKLFYDGACVCTLRQIEEDEILKEDKDIILYDGVHFVLSEEEKNELIPVINEREEIL